MASGVVLQRLVRARDYLHGHLHEAPTLDELAREAQLSRAHLARQFSATFGVSPHQYLIGLRLDQAKLKLASGAAVTDVCLELGFESLGSFSTSFTRHIGMSPRAYQKLARPFVQSRGVPMVFVPACYFWKYAEHV